ncbi:MAG: beta-propeller fold lactonase family protein [Candidatus Binatia bacterium]
MIDNVSRRRFRLAAVVAAALALPAAAARAACVGDCNANGVVAVNELVTGVNIALGNSPLNACAVFDTDGTNQVEIYELIAAVGNLLNTCNAGPPSKTNKSSPIAVSPDGSTVVTANIDTDTISVFTIGAGGQLAKVKEVAVGQEPRSVAILSNKPWVYVANTLSGTVQVISLLDYSTVATIPVGTEPWAVVAAPNGLYVYAANASSNTVSAIDTTSNVVFATVPVGRSPRALAITNDGDGDDLDEHIYVPNFYARPRAGFTPPSTANLGGADAANAFPAGARGQAVIGEGIFDDSREAVIDVVSATSNTVVDHVRVLGPVADTGFKVAAGAFRHQRRRRRPAHHLRRRRQRRHRRPDHRRLPQPAAQRRPLRQPRLRTQHSGVAGAAAAPQRQRAEPALGVRPRQRPRARRPDLQSQQGHQLRPARRPRRGAGARQHRSPVPLGAA